jgi:hypothetical protein
MDVLSSCLKHHIDGNIPFGLHFGRLMLRRSMATIFLLRHLIPVCHDNH